MSDVEVWQCVDPRTELLDREYANQQFARSLDEFIANPDRLSAEVAGRVLVLSDLLMTKGRKGLPLPEAALWMLRRIRAASFLEIPLEAGDQAIINVLIHEGFCDKLTPSYSGKKRESLYLTDKGKRELGDRDGNYGNL